MAALLTILTIFFLIPIVGMDIGKDSSEFTAPTTAFASRDV